MADKKGKKYSVTAKVVGSSGYLPDAMVGRGPQLPAAGDQLRTYALAREGLRVILSNLKGITDKGLLEVPFAFQCPPLEDFSVEHSHGHSDYDTVGAGQFSRRGGRQLRTVSFDTLFVDYGTFALHHDLPTEDLTAILTEILNSGSPFLLTVAHHIPLTSFPSLEEAPWNLTMAGPQLQMPATLRTLRVGERAGEGDARYVNVSFTEYRDPVVAKVGRKRGKKDRAGQKEWPRWVVISPNGSAVTDKGYLLDRKVTLANLAQTFYGDPSGARHIALANGMTDWGPNSTLDFHPRVLAGQRVLEIPRPWSGVTAGVDRDQPAMGPARQKAANYVLNP